MHGSVDLGAEEAVERTAREPEHLCEHPDARGAEVALHVGDGRVLGKAMLSESCNRPIWDNNSEPDRTRTGAR